jgi:hypothetical protein
LFDYWLNFTEWVFPQGATNGHDFTAWFARTDYTRQSYEGGNNYLCPQTFPQLTDSVLFTNILGSYYGANDLTRTNWGMADGTYYFWRFARDVKPCGCLLAVSTYTTNGWEFHQWSDAYGGAVPLLSPVAQYYTTNASLPSITFTIQGDDGRSEIHAVDTNIVLSLSWDDVTNVIMGGAGNIGDSMTLCYTNNSLLYFSASSLYSYGNTPIWYLNSTMLNQYQKIWNAFRWLRGSVGFYNETAYIWTGYSTQSWTLAIADAASHRANYSQLYGEEPFYGVRTMGMGYPPGINQYGQPYNGQWWARAVATVSHPTASPFLSSTQMVDFCHDIDFYMSFNRYRPGPYAGYPVDDDKSVLSWQGSSFCSATNILQHYPSVDMSGVTAISPTSTVTFGQSTIPSDWCTDPAYAVQGKWYVRGWQAGNGASLYRFDVSGGFKYQ